MHIEPGIVEPTKMLLSYVTVGGALIYSAKQVYDHVINNGAFTFLAKSLITTLIVFASFQILPHHAVGVSEVHIILGSTLFLLFGTAPAAMGLILGLLFQGVFFAPLDLPQFGMNLTTLLMPLFLMQTVANKLITPNTAYKDISYKQAFALSSAFQVGIAGWVAFWALYGQGFGIENIQNIGIFAVAYSSVIIIEPFIDLGILAIVKNMNKLKTSNLFEHRLFNHV